MRSSRPERTELQTGREERETGGGETGHKETETGGGERHCQEKLTT